MSQFIIEMGSGNSCHNNLEIVRLMIEAVAAVDTGKHEVIFKYQLFEDEPPNDPLWWSTFAYAYGYAWELGYQTTASVFDISSLWFLEKFDVPFVKIANRPNLYYLARETKKPCYVSCQAKGGFPELEDAVFLECVSKYPAVIDDYCDVDQYGAWWPSAISDHTVGWDLYHKANPHIIEKHFCLEQSDDNPDGGPFAATAEELAEVL